jgi:farnesyl diphosphate synthase
MNNDKILQYITHHETVLQGILQETEIPAARIRDAMHYSLFPGGKRIRPVLVYLTGELLHAEKTCLDTIAAAIELIHCYSLVHDDLPAMDNDDFRRGKPSCHRAFDEATAILVGDGMQALAIEILLSRLPAFLTTDKVVAVTRELVIASGPSGMVSGQSLDLSELCNPALDESKLKTIHSLKTGKLILACIKMVLAACNPSSDVRNALQDYAQHLGLVFQMQDDYLDKYGSIELLGKGRASDSANEKVTFASLFTQKDLQQLITNHFQLAKESLSLFQNRSVDLLALTSQLQQRGMTEIPA